jgi:GT2 family glycosyltransferase
VIHADRNQGPAAARNAGWNATSAPYIAFTDDDCEPQPGWLAAGLAALEADGRVGIVQGKTVRAQDGADYPYTCFTVVREVLQPTPWFEGCNLFFRREALKDGGGFDEHLGYFGEETSLAWQAIEAGWERAWADDAVVEHELADRPWRWHMRIHYLERNTAWLVARHPQMRAMFWRPWAVKREGALFALAALGLAIGVRYRVGLLLTLPYLRWLPPPWRKEIGWQGVGHLVSIHAASFVGKVAGSARERTLLL